MGLFFISLYERTILVHLEINLVGVCLKIICLDGKSFVFKAYGSFITCCSL